MGRTKRFVEVFIGETEPVLVGSAFFNESGSRLTTTFSYSEEWLSSQEPFALAPRAELTQKTSYWQGLPSFLADSSPDRWGRSLIKMGANRQVLPSRQPSPTLDDVGFLVEVDDWARMGAYRIRYNGGTDFVGENTAIPKLDMLPKLAFEASQFETDDYAVEPLRSLLAVGASALGGARPKVTVARDGALYVAKFPSREDAPDAAAWEAWALKVAQSAGCKVPEVSTYSIGSSAALLSKRFDRDGSRRVAYMSGRTLLAQGNEVTQTDYADLGDSISYWCADPSKDLLELFKRVVISIAIHNTDDHMNNHGFIHEANGWKLAPLFDVNPNFDLGTERVTNIYGYRGPEESDGLPLLAKSFGLSSAQVADVVEEAHEALRSSWLQAHKLGCRERKIAFAQEFVTENLSRIFTSTKQYA